MNDANSQAVIKLKTCEMHTCGEPVRILKSIIPPIPFPNGSTILEKRSFFSKHFDHIRKMAILEPRGHNDMFGAVLTDPDETSGSDFGLLFLNNEGYAPMCGHVTLAVGRYLLEKRFVNAIEPETEIKLDCPCGLIKIRVEWDGKFVGNSKFQSVPAFVQTLDYNIYVPELQISVKCDLVFGGNFYALVTDDHLGVKFGKHSPAKIVDSATFLFNTLKENCTFHHPNKKDLEYLYGIIVTSAPQTDDVVNTLCVFGIKSFDRSPCGSGTTALVVSQFIRGNLKLGQKKITQNPFLGENSRFIGRPVEEITMECGNKGIVVEITGRAFFTGKNTMTNEVDDCFKFGFIV